MDIILTLTGVLLGACLAALILSRRLASMRARLGAVESELAGERRLRSVTADVQERELAILQEHHARELEGLRAQVELVRGNREQLRDELKSISADVLKETGDSLAQRLSEQRRAEQERMSSEMARRTAEIRGLMEPVQQKLGRMESEIGRLERERREGQGQITAMVRQLHEGVGSLRQETGNLVSALKRPNTRGAWGELQLRNVIEMAGMVEHCDFLEQSTVQGEEGALRPDVLVKLPGGKLVVIDAKVPLDAYLAHLEASDDRGREVELARHARQTREHVAKLASRGYQHQFDSTPELVVMFVPSEGIYHAALSADPALIEYGVQQHVLIATPTTLIGLLRAIHYGWRQELIAESAREIAESARELHRRLGRFVEPLAKVGRQLDSAVGAYNEAVGSFDRRVMPQLKKLEDTGAHSERELSAPVPLERQARVPSAAAEDDLTLAPEQGTLDVGALVVSRLRTGS